ncbi:unnamed protein product [Thlaspi arvense]|uniref:Uncharacterized protein n=1 Tax=Thlaspi arvense TaxID=13288 RepID=A0AAU9RPQ9_THLAR|nr:unnamed protein product [Thlaspi arvense]
MTTKLFPLKHRLCLHTTIGSGRCLTLWTG